ncbi:hypothetical protein UFOVP39_4 [uncultured Caudovirales phage]|uniref:DUF6973 domain-containing protein n=1 Tax=uncultured Caudovirales phage TaxID=2100421 RepID=A0A6J5T7E5_9CAUD|nr:hypothetical protein UFOVP39_4 [uncultured Caudovirales phage]
MADTLQELFNTPPGMFSKISDPFDLRYLANQAAIDEYGWKNRSGGETDALRHLLGVGILTKRHGPEYAQTISDLHENPYIPWIGGLGQSEADRNMDLYNNKLGIQLGTQAKSYEDLLQTAKQYVDSGKVQRAVVPQPKAAKPPSRDYVDDAINGSVNLIKQMFSR